MKNNIFVNKFHQIYHIGFLIILALPLLSLPPWFNPPDWGKTMVFKTILAVFLFLFVYQWLYKKNELDLPDVKKNYILWALAALLAIFFVASVFSVDPYFSFLGSPIRSGGFINMAFYALFGMAIFLFAKEKEWKRFFDVSILVGILVSLVAIIQYHGLFNHIFLATPDRPPSTIGNPIFLGIYLLMLLFLTITFFIQEKNRVYKVFYGGAALLFFYVMLISGSRASYLGFMVGLVYFLLFYPKKMVRLKIAVIAVLLLAGSGVYYANSQSHFPAALEHNQIFKSVQPRLSIKTFLSDSRFPAWEVGFKAFLQKPVLGFGPENYSVGFDKNYNAAVGSQWWDRAHNVLLEIAATAGAPAVILYLLLFAALFWLLQKIKTKEAHALQTTFIAYLVANFFSIDSFSSYLLFFMLIGYSLHLARQQQAEPAELKNPVRAGDRSPWWKKIAISLAGLTLVIFLWQYILIPFLVNADIESAQHLAGQGQCDQAFTLMDNALAKPSFVNAYAELSYVEIIKNCAKIYPQNTLAYATKGAGILQQAVLARPTYTRSWLYLGSFTTIMANSEQNPETKKALIADAYVYFKKAEALAPSHTDTLIEEAKTDVVAQNYQQIKTQATQCLAKDPNLGECYWLKAMFEIYNNDISDSQKDIAIARSKEFTTDATLSLYQLADAYAYAKDYRDLAATYLELINRSPDVPEYHSSLAFTYANMGQYPKTRAEALRFLQLMPSAKDEVDAFLKTLPY